ncbi:MAG: STAS/SEC14 domain-containing protein [Candidatus Competibacteraceae bacterium]|nr:STAS/SEC14 domain-containing protein [Candidatus Competibacteraceae bacterium]
MAISSPDSRLHSPDYPERAVDWAEFQTFLTQAETENVFASGKVKLLIQLQNFAGWEPGEQWGMSAFSSDTTKDIEKIAVVSDPAGETTC